MAVLSGDRRDAAPAPGHAPARRNVLMRYLSRFDDGEVVRWAFRGMLIGTIGVLALDLQDLSQRNGWWDVAAEAPQEVPLPMLPPAVESDQPALTGDPRRFVTADETRLAQPMTFALGKGGVLLAEGSILPGTAARFAAEVEARGEYINVVSLNSPGGALDDAMTMARLIRQNGIGAEVADGAICASSCPLFMSGGKTRTVGAEAAVGVHQFYAAARGEGGPAQAMADAQATTARISRHLAEMGVDPALWLHALDTPPQALYYLSPKELEDYKLVTRPVPKANPA